MIRIRFTLDPRSGQDLPGRKTRRLQYCGSPILTQRGTADKTAPDLCAGLSGKWRALLCHRRRRDVPGTNRVEKRDKAQDLSVGTRANTKC